MYYEKKLNSPNSLIKKVIELKNKVFESAMKIYYSKTNNKAKLCYKYRNNYNNQIYINIWHYSNNNRVLIVINLI